MKRRLSMGRHEKYYKEREAQENQPNPEASGRADFTRLIERCDAPIDSGHHPNIKPDGTLRPNRREDPEKKIDDS